jgi:DNA-binding transcriptional MerR regulator
MKFYSTGQVARLIKVHKQTLLDWLRDRKIPEPERQAVASLEVRVWTAKDLQIAREYRTTNYGKWNPKKKKKARG